MPTGNVGSSLTFASQELNKIRKNISRTSFIRLLKPEYNFALAGWENKSDDHRLGKSRSTLFVWEKISLVTVILRIFTSCRRSLIWSKKKSKDLKLSLALRCWFSGRFLICHRHPIPMRSLMSWEHETGKPDPTNVAKLPIGKSHSEVDT
jgi:hypothetical protein